MRNLYTFILSCISLLAGGQDVQVMTFAKTNHSVVYTSETFAREGHTNLVCQITTVGGVVTRKVQTFYQDGSKIATYLLVQSPPTYMSQFFTEPNAHYSAALEFSPSNQINFLVISSNVTSVVDAFTCTNENFCPVGAALVSKLNAFPKTVTATWSYPMF